MKALQFTGSIPHYVVTAALGRISRGAYWGPLSCLVLREVPEPVLPGPDWAVVRTRYAGICGSDMHLILLQQSPSASALASFPFTVGHENVGVVAEAGEEVGLEPGQRVVVEPLLPCATRAIDRPCRACREGHHARCEKFASGSLSPGLIIGSCRDTGGTWSPKFLAHRSQLFPVPDAVSDEAAVLVEPLAASLHAAARALAWTREGGRPDETALVIGGGVIGLGVIAALRALGWGGRLIVLVRHPHQAELARTFGGDEVVGTGPGWEERLAESLGVGLLRPLIGPPVPTGGAAMVFECAGSRSALDAALRYAAPGGLVSLVGLTGTPKGIDWSHIWRKELDVRGNFCYDTEVVESRRVRTFELVLDLLTDGRLGPAAAVEGLVTHRFRLEDYREALRTVTDKGSSRAIKAVFTFDR
ncbi:MAG TPA: alcohol dehydrogenase [Clostridiales bacterium]|nr:alcohol dehydrogenase [Clostridiales bacterium]